MQSAFFSLWLLYFIIIYSPMALLQEDGQIVATLVWVKDLGEREREFKGEKKTQDMFNLVFEVNWQTKTNDNGETKPVTFTIKWLTKSTTDKSNATSIAAALWADVKTALYGEDVFDLFLGLRGKHALVEAKNDSYNGNEYVAADKGTFAKVPKAMQAGILPVITESFAFDFRDPEWKNTYNESPDWAKKDIEASLTFKKLMGEWDLAKEEDEDDNEMPLPF